MKKVLAIVMVAFIAVTVGMLGIKYKKEKKLLEETAALSERITALKAKKNSLENEIKADWREYERMKKGGENCVVLFYDNMSDNLMEEIYPVISNDEYGYVGVMVMADLKIPGDEDCITKQDYDTLKDDGWSFALGTGNLKLSGSTETLRDYLSKYKEILESNGFEMPRTFCFDVGQFDEKYIEVLKEFGFNVARHYGEVYDVLATNIEEDGIYMLGAEIMSSAPTTLKADLTEAQSKSLTLGVSVRYVTRNIEDQTKDCSYARYADMLNYVKNKKLNVKNADEMYADKMRTLDEAEKFLATFNDNMEEKEARLEEVNAEIEELVQQ